MSVLGASIVSNFLLLGIIPYVANLLASDIGFMIKYIFSYTCMHACNHALLVLYSFIIGWTSSKYDPKTVWLKFFQISFVTKFKKLSNAFFSNRYVGIKSWFPPLVRRFSGTTLNYILIWLRLSLSRNLLVDPTRQLEDGSSSWTGNRMWSLVISRTYVLFVLSVVALSKIPSTP